MIRAGSVSPVEKGTSRKAPQPPSPIWGGRLFLFAGKGAWELPDPFQIKGFDAFTLSTGDGFIGYLVSSKKPSVKWSAAQASSMNYKMTKDFVCNHIVTE